MGRTRKGEVTVSKDDGVKRTVVIALRTTTAEREELAAKVKAAGFASFQEAFDAFIATASPSGALSQLERDYMTKRGRADAIERKMLKRKINGKPVMKTLMNLYIVEFTTAGHDARNANREVPPDWEKLIAAMLKKWPYDLSDVLTFKEWLSLWKDLFEMRVKIISGQTQPVVAVASAASGISTGGSPLSSVPVSPMMIASAPSGSSVVVDGSEGGLVMDSSSTEEEDESPSLEESEDDASAEDGSGSEDGSDPL